jgi:hypothetical protein
MIEETPKPISEQIKENIKKVPKKLDLSKPFRQDKIEIEEPSQSPLIMSTPRKVISAQKQRRLEDVSLPYSEI